MRSPNLLCRSKRHSRPISVSASLSLAAAFAGHAVFGLSVNPGARYSSDAGAVGTLRFEAESISVQQPSPAAYRMVTDPKASGGALAVLQAGGPNESVTYRLPVSSAGTYEVSIGLKTRNDRGRFQLSIDGTNFGAVQEGYSVVPGYEFRNVATTITFYTPGERTFRFSIIGRDQRSSGYGLGLDYIQLTPRRGSAGEQSQGALTRLPQADAGDQGLWEQYGVTSTGVTLRWKVFTPPDTGTH